MVRDYEILKEKGTLSGETTLSKLFYIPSEKKDPL